MKFKFCKTIRSKMILLQTGMMLIVLGIIFLVFIFFADDYYYNRKLSVMENAFEYFKESDIDSLKQGDSAVIRFEEQKLNFIIADEKFDCVYITGLKKTPEKTASQVHNKITKKAESYKAEFVKEKQKHKIIGYGAIDKGAHRYYVYIYERKLNTQIQFSYYQLFFAIICFVALVAGVIVVGIISNRISRPIRKIEKAASNAIENNFDVNIDETFEFEEISGLARSINIMMTQIRKQMKTLEQELMNKSVTEEKRKTFVNNVSHELKTPLAIISSQVEMLQLIDDDAGKQEYCKSIMEETSRMAELINDMIVVYSAQRDENELGLEDTDIGKLVESVCATYRDLLEKYNITMHQEYETDCRAMVNQRYIEQAVDNYISNSIKHSSESGNVFVRVMKNDDYVRVEVENDGAPVTEDDKDKIWDMFYKGDINETLHGLKGSGLGLYIVRSIVELHNGNYGFKNLNKGVVFWIEIPTE